MPLVLAVALLKFLSHKLGFEIMELNALFTSLVAGTIFLIGFLISGVLSDYKESEKIPGEIASCLEALADEALFMHYKKKSELSKQWLENILQTQKLIMDWLHQKTSLNPLYYSHH